MKLFAYFVIAFVVLNTVNAIHAQQITIPIASSKNLNHHIAQEESIKTTKKTKFKRNFVKHSTFKKACIYSGCALGGIVAGICLFNLGFPIIVSAILIGVEIVAQINGLFIH